MRYLALVGLATGAAFATAAPAAEYRLGQLRIATPWIRATPPGAPAAAGFLTIFNDGAQSVRVVGIDAKFSARAEIHEMKMDGGVMAMRPLEDGIEIGPGASVELAPGGYHVMFIGIGEKLSAGQKRSVTLDFGSAGRIAVEFQVEPIGATAPSN